MLQLQLKPAADNWCTPHQIPVINRMEELLNKYKKAGCFCLEIKRNGTFQNQDWPSLRPTQQPTQIFCYALEGFANLKGKCYGTIAGRSSGPIFFISNILLDVQAAAVFFSLQNQ